MAIRTKAKIDSDQIADMDLTISVTMSVEDWQKLMQDQPRTHPSWALADHINQVLAQLARATATEVSINHPVQ